MALNQFDAISSSANITELMDLDYLLEQTESSLIQFMNSKNIENSNIAKIVFNNIRKLHSDLITRVSENIIGTNENAPISKPIKCNDFDEKQFISQTYNSDYQKSYKCDKYKQLHQTSVENYTKMLSELNELETIYNETKDITLHVRIKTLQTKITRQKKRILAVSNK